MQTVCIQFDQQLETIEQLEYWIQDLLWEKQIQGVEADPVTVLRLKGIIYPPKDKNLSNAKKRLVIQGVQDLYDIQEGYSEEDESNVLSKIVLIGKDLQKDKLSASFRDILKIEHKVI